MDTPVITLSDPGFYRKITGKYQKGRRNPFGYPLMVFFKNALQSISQKINMNILVQLHFHNQNITSHLIKKSVRDVKAMLQWFKVEKFIPLKNTGFSGVYPVGTTDERFLLFLKSVVLRAGDVITVLNKTIHPFSKTNPESFPQIPQYPPNFGNQVQIIKPETKAVANTMIVTNSPDLGVKIYSPAEYPTEYPSAWGYKFAFECKSPAILSQVNLLLNRWISSDAAIYSLASGKSYNISTSMANLQLTDYSKYVQIINSEYSGYNSVFETAILPQESLLLNRPVLSDIALLSQKIYNLSPEYSVTGYKSPAIIPHVNLLLNSWIAPFAVPGGIFNVSTYAETLNLNNKGHFNYTGNRSSYRFTASGYRLPTILPSVNLLLDSGMIQDATSHGQEIYDTSPQVETMKNQSAGYGSYVQIPNPTYQSAYKSSPAIPQESHNVSQQAADLHFAHHSDYAWNINQKYHSAFERSSPAVIPQVSLLISSSVPKSEGLPDQIYQTAIFIKPDMHGYGTVNLAPFKKLDTMKENDNLYFQNNQKIEKAIEQIKKIAEEARQTAVDSIRSAHSSEEKGMPHQINVNRLSDEVYQLIDRRIKIERERRGYI